MIVKNSMFKAHRSKFKTTNTKFLAKIKHSKLKQKQIKIPNSHSEFKIQSSKFKTDTCRRSKSQNSCNPFSENVTADMVNQIEET